MTERTDLWVVEDNPNDLELMRHALRRIQLQDQTRCFSDGVEALEVLHGGAEPSSIPRLMVLDLKLPRMSGLEVLRRLRGHDRTRLMPVVILTSSQQDRDIQDCYQAGANSYLVKPVDFSRFAQAVEVLGRYWLTLNQSPP